MAQNSISNISLHIIELESQVSRYIDGDYSFSEVVTFEAASALLRHNCQVISAELDGTFPPSVQRDVLELGRRFAEAERDFLAAEARTRARARAAAQAYLDAGATNAAAETFAQPSQDFTELSRRLGEAASAGQAAFGALLGQGRRLSSVLDGTDELLGKMGVSNQLLQQIRRSQYGGYILAVALVIILCFIYGIIRWFVKH